MKKLITTIAIVASAYAVAQAQGLVIFNNSTTTKLSTNSVVGGAATGLMTGQFYFALFYSSTDNNVGGSSSASLQTSSASIGNYVFNSSNAGNWTQVASGTNTATAGRFASTTADANSDTALNGLIAGTQYNFVVVGWSANLGNSIAALEASLGSGVSGLLGESVVGQITPGNGTSIPASGTFGTAAPFLQGFTLGQVVPVPEPGTMALAALGGASLLMFRRKK